MKKITKKKIVRKLKLKMAKRIIKRRKAPKRSVRKIVISSRERRFVIPISIRIPISRRSFAVMPSASPALRRRSFWAAIFGKKFSVAKAGLVLALTVGLNLFGFLSIGNTVAFYNDTESSNGNIFVAGSLDFTVDVEKPDNRFQTHTQGGWGAGAHGNNPGAYRDLNFASAFPSGAVIGLPGANYSATFTDAEAVKDFLPAGSTPMPFIGDHVDPILTEAGVLAGQVLALTLNVGFDLYDPDLALSVNNLKDYVIDDSSVPCDGMTVQEVLDEANTILGGLPSVFSASEINECATWINEEFDGGGDDGLVPGGSITQFATIVNEGTLGFQYTVEVEKTGGDEDFCNALDLEAVLEGTTNYTGNLMDFVSSPVVYSVSADEWEFIISLPADADVEGSCSFDFVFSGWQTTLPNFGGFSDIERVDDPVHSVASITVESGDGNGGTDSGGESAIQEFGLDNEPKGEEAVTGEGADDTGNPDGDGGDSDGDGQADEDLDEGTIVDGAAGNEETTADGAAGNDETVDGDVDSIHVLGDSSGDESTAEEDGAHENDSFGGGVAEPDGSIEPPVVNGAEPLPSDPLPPAIDPTADSSSDPVSSTTEPSPPLEPSGEGLTGQAESTSESTPAPAPSPEPAPAPESPTPSEPAS